MRMEKVNFEEAMKRLEKIVRELEDGQLPLERAIDKFEEALKLASICRQKLEKAKLRIEKLVRKGDEYTSEPFEPEEEENEGSEDI